MLDGMCAQQCIIIASAIIVMRLIACCCARIVHCPLDSWFTLDVGVHLHTAHNVHSYRNNCIELHFSCHPVVCRLQLASSCRHAVRNVELSSRCAQSKQGTQFVCRARPAKSGMRSCTRAFHLGPTQCFQNGFASQIRMLSHKIGFLLGQRSTPLQ
jgi:hypothetical protein